jgi:hypothetical protein
MKRLYIFFILKVIRAYQLTKCHSYIIQISYNISHNTNILVVQKF